MKCAVAILALASCLAPVRSNSNYKFSGPGAVERVVELLQQLEAKIQDDGKLEQSAYDKYACWCEESLGRTAAEINTAKASIKDLQVLIEQLKGDIASHNAEIVQLNKDIAANIEATRDATALREKESSAYEQEKIENEQCIGALEAAINVLNGAGTGQKFLQNIQMARVLSVVDGVRTVLQKQSDKMSYKDVETMKQFIAQPEKFVGQRPSLSAAQTKANPYGDYAPQSTQIQGILKGMYEAFIKDLEKATAEEADQQKNFLALEATKKMELGVLQATLERQTYDESQKSTKLAESGELQDSTEEELAADEEFFATAKAGCKAKAGEWSERTRLRTEELQGIHQAIQVLSAADAVAIFGNATKGVSEEEAAEDAEFIQISAHQQGRKIQGKMKDAAYAHLVRLAKEYRSKNVASIATVVQAGGYFNKVIASIDEMIALLRKEDMEDIKHRDRCQGSQNKNSNDLIDVEHDINKAETEQQRLSDAEGTLDDTLTELNTAINKTKGDIEDLLELRNTERTEFEKGLKDDADAISLLEAAIVYLTKFYKKNKIPISLVAKDDPSYTEDPKKAPKTWSGSYGGRSSESHGIVSIIRMIKEDLEKEMKTSRVDDSKAQAEYEKANKDLVATKDAQLNTKMATEREKAEVNEKITDLGKYITEKKGDKGAEKKLETSIQSDCTWVETHFDARHTARTHELAGLQEAKDYLAACDDGTALAP